MSVCFFVALPGTELFDSLHDAKQIRFDRDYFDHIFGQVLFKPSASHAPELPPFKLSWWKIRMVWRFYNQSIRRKQHRGSWTSVLAGIRKVNSHGHESKLQTALVNGFSRARAFVASLFERRWLSRADEHELFKDWDNIYAAVRADRIARGIADISPADTTELHRRNAIKVFSPDHNTSRTLNILPSDETPNDVMAG